MRTTALLLISLSLALSCRAVKKNQQTTEQTTELQAEQSIKIETISQALTTAQQSTALEHINFQIEPICGQPAVFRLMHNGKEIKGETTGNLIFNNEKKEETQNTRTQNQEAKSENTQDKARYQTVYKDRIIEKEVKQGFSLWLWVAFVLGIIALWELLKYVVKSRLKIKQWL